MLQDHFSPISDTTSYKPHQIGSSIRINSDEFPSLDSAKLAIVGLPQGDLKNPFHTANCVRKEFYNLAFNEDFESVVVDLGNLVVLLEEDYNDVMVDVMAEFRQKEITPVFIGGNLKSSMPIYSGLKQLKDNIDLTLVSSDIPMQKDEFLDEICTEVPNYLFNLTILGCQRHLVPSKTLRMMETLGFTKMRLGQLKARVEDSEPAIRNTDMVVFDMGAVSHVYAPGCETNTTAGLDCDLSCQLSWYSGVSDTCKAFSICNMDSTLDNKQITATLVAQICWYFMDGFVNRKNDHPEIHSEFYKYRCNLNANNPDIMFFKSKRTNRWWMQLPLHQTSSSQYIPCTYNDYQIATNGDLPERFFKALQHAP